MASDEQRVKRAAPRIWTLPEIDTSREWSGKFLQLELDSSPWLLFAGRDACSFHNQLLARFLTELGVDHHWPTTENLAYDDQRVRVAGGGRFRIDIEAGAIELWDDSTAYGRFDETRLRRELAAACPPWSALAPHIR